MNTLQVTQEVADPFRYVGPAFEMPKETDDTDWPCPFCGEVGGVHGSVDCHGE